MRLLIKFSLIFCCLTTTGQSRFGYINYEKALSGFPQSGEREMEIGKRTNELNDSLKVLVDRFEDFAKSHYPRNLTNDTVFMKKMQDKLLKIQTDIINYQEYGKKEIERIHEKWDLAIKQNVLKELNQFSSDNNVICVADKKSILYCKECKDFTDDFLQYVKEKRK